jgi:hypothetical protein
MTTVIGYELTERVAQRLADRGDPDAFNFGLKDLGVAVDHLSEAELHDLIHTAYHILACRSWAALTNRQQWLLLALDARIDEHIRQPN